MKNLLLTLVVFSVLLLIGCQENNITDPVQTDTVNKTNGDNTALKSGTIKLDHILVGLGGGNNYFELNGRINFIHEIFQTDPIPPVPQYYVSLKLSTNATMTNVNHPTVRPMVISGESEDIIYVSEEGIYLLEKTYTVQGENSGMLLVCRFLVTTDGVGLNAVWLSVADGGGTLNKESTPGGTTTFSPVKVNTSQ